MASTAPNPRVGVSAIIYGPDGKMVTGKRKGSHGAGTWQLPGGHLDYGESILVCAEREVLEETGLKVRGIKIVAVTNDVFEKEAKHYITLFVLCEMEDKTAQPQVLEPQKCDGWYWKTWEDLKQLLPAVSQGEQGESLFLPLVNLLEQTDNLDTLRS
ncbi:Nudix hydrolase domain-containing protein [Fusarium sp. LHS14.1]|nr:Nudix hydrolase domain-containing protein [Fusarium sp. LHS14.1]